MYTEVALHFGLDPYMINNLTITSITNRIMPSAQRFPFPLSLYSSWASSFMYYS